MPADLAGLYEDDVVLWSDRQAELLRRLAAGERVNAEIDWKNVIEEIELVGGSQRSAVESLLARAVEHLLKVHGWPDGPVDHWSREARTFLNDARRRWAPSMARLIDLADIYAEAFEEVSRLTVAGRPPRALPAVCPFVHDDLISRRGAWIDLSPLLAKLSA